MLLGQVMSKGSLLVSMMLFSRYLDDGFFGGLLLAVSIGQILFFVTDMGVGLEVNRSMSVDGTAGRLLVRSALEARLLLSGAGILAASGMSAVLFPDLLRSGVLPLICLSQVLESFAELGFSVFRAVERSGVECAARTVSGMVSVAGALAVTAAGMDPLAAAGVYVLRGALAAAMSLSALARSRSAGLPGSRPTVSALLRASVPLGILGLLMVLHQRVDSTILGALSGERSVGAYQQCYRLLDSLVLVVTPTLLPGALFPGLCRAFREGGAVLADRFSAILGLTLSLGSSFSAFLLGAGGSIHSLLWGPGFLRGQDPAAYAACHRVAGIAIIPLFAMNMLLAAQLAAGLERRAVRASVAGLAVLAAVDLAAIPAIGIAGAALGVAVSCTVLCLLLYRGLRSSGDLRPGRAAASAMKSALPAFGVMIAARTLLGEGIPAGLASLAAGLAGGAAAILPRFRESPYCRP